MSRGAGVWVELPAAGLWARALRVSRADVAFFKHLFESHEEVGLIRTAQRLGEAVVIAVVAPPDFRGVADEILEDVVRRGSPSLEPAELPAHCREDWFLEEWAGPAEQAKQWGHADSGVGSSLGSRRVKR